MRESLIMQLKVGLIVMNTCALLFSLEKSLALK